jgi:hypothetical protein
MELHLGNLRMLDLANNTLDRKTDGCTNGMGHFEYLLSQNKQYLANLDTYTKQSNAPMSVIELAPNAFPLAIHNLSRCQVTSIRLLCPYPTTPNAHPIQQTLLAIQLKIPPSTPPSTGQTGTPSPHPPLQRYG